MEMIKTTSKDGVSTMDELIEMLSKLTLTELLKEWQTVIQENCDPQYQQALAIVISEKMK